MLPPRNGRGRLSSLCRRMLARSAGSACGAATHPLLEWHDLLVSIAFPGYLPTTPSLCAHYSATARLVGASFFKYPGNVMFTAVRWTFTDRKDPIMHDDKTVQRFIAPRSRCGAVDPRVYRPKN